VNSGATHAIVDSDSDARRILALCEYPDFTFELLHVSDDPIWTPFAWTVRFLRVFHDSLNPGKKIIIRHGAVIPRGVTEEAFVRLIFQNIREALIHECSEQFVYNNEKVFWPHQ
jgi:hypothetical protein